MRMQRKKALGVLQDLIGRAKGAYLNDRARDRADLLLPPLDFAFRLVVALRSESAIGVNRVLKKIEVAEDGRPETAE